MDGITVSISMAIAICLCFATAILSSSIASSRWMNSRDNGKSHMKHHCLHFFILLFGFGSCVVGHEITGELLQRFNLMAQYSAAAYCPGNNNGTGTLITCSIGNCPLVEAARARGTFEFEDTIWADSTGFLAVDDTNRLIVLAFRGSESLSNWKVDLDIIRRPADLCRDCDVHRGFWHAWTEIRERVTTKVLSVLETYPEHRYVITGHSLGGAMAILAAGNFRKLNDDLAARTELYTFGSPRVGNRYTVAFLTAQSDLSFRVTSMSDPVPREPGHILGYEHTSPEFWIHDHPQHPGPNDIKFVTGFYNEDGNSGERGFNISRHNEYFGPISKCWTDGESSA